MNALFWIIEGTLFHDAGVTQTLSPQFRSRAQLADHSKLIICWHKMLDARPLLSVHLCLNLSNEPHRRENQLSNKCKSFKLTDLRVIRE